ncbi:MAG TPA: protease pro-enzyme activation domain-containing protein [Candidatus Sulfotelmatobacter sp.]|nr:protease pro-enzyme activation domain-containing protein [Candidatus Sulfotelmatobacter sp.]
MLRKACPVVALGCLVALLLVSGLPVYAQSSAASRALITQKIDESALVRLAGNTRPEVQYSRDLGLVSDSLQLSHMYLQMKMSPDQEADVAAFVTRLHDPAAAEYHKWLSVPEIENRFGPAPEDLRAVSTWLESHGFTINVVYRANGVIDFSGPASAIREAFHTEIHNIEVKGAVHIANIRDPQIPAALFPAVVGVTSMNDFRPHTNIKPRMQFDSGSPIWPFLLVPGDLATIYDFNPVYQAGISGRGQTIMVVEDSDIYSADDWNNFRAAFGLNTRFPSGSLQQTHPQPSNSPANGGPCADPLVNPDDGEAAVDMEWASAAAPGATIVVASCADTNTNFGGFIAIQNVLTNFPPPPGVISISYGQSESEDGASFNIYIDSLYRLGVLRGVSIYVSAGDADGDTTDQFGPAAVAGLNVSGFTVSQYDVSVGGTDFTDTFNNQNATYWSPINGPFFNSALSYIPEMPWDDSCANVPLTKFAGFATPYGADGFCNSKFGENFLIVAGGSGGASSCFTGTPAIFGVVGGTCNGYPKPPFQYLAAGIPFDGVRDIPDITMFAANGLWGHYYVFCYSDPNFGGSPCVAGHPELWAGAGGTSFGAPIMAGVQALINQAVDTQFQGDPNFVYYPLDLLQNVELPLSACNSNLGANVNPRCIFHDVTFGDNDVNCLPLTNPITGAVIGTFNCFLDGATNGVLSLSNNTYEPTYTAKLGYDLTSGIGSADVFHLVKNWPGSKLH